MSDFWSFCPAHSHHRRTEHFFLEEGGLSHLCRKKYFDIARKKTAMLTCKIALPDSLDGMNSVFYRLINTKKYSSFLFLAAG